MAQLGIKWPVLSAVLFTNVVGWALFITFGLVGWPGETSELDCFTNYLTEKDCFCEKPRERSFMAQPIATLSNLIYNVMAIFVAWSADTKRFPSSLWWENHVNLITQHKYFVTLFCCVLTSIGIASSILHSSLTFWGDAIDKLMIFALMLWLILFALVKFTLMWKGWSPEGIVLAAKMHALLFGICLMVTGVLHFYRKFNVKLLFQSINIFIFVEIFLRVWYLYCKDKERASKFWIGSLGILLFGGTYALDNLAGSVCNPESLFQIHALWHVGSAISVTCIFFFQLSERFIMKKRLARGPVSSIFISTQRLKRELSESASGLSQSIFRGWGQRSDTVAKNDEIKESLNENDSYTGEQWVENPKDADINLEEGENKSVRVKKAESLFPISKLSEQSQTDILCDVDMVETSDNYTNKEESNTNES